MVSPLSPSVQPAYEGLASLAQQFMDASDAYQRAEQALTLAEDNEHQARRAKQDAQMALIGALGESYGTPQFAARAILEIARLRKEARHE